MPGLLITERFSAESTGLSDCADEPPLVSAMISFKGQGRADVRFCACLCGCTCVYTHIRMHTYIHTCAHMHTDIDDVCMCVCVCVCRCLRYFVSLFVLLFLYLAYICRYLYAMCVTLPASECPSPKHETVRQIAAKACFTATSSQSFIAAAPTRPARNLLARLNPPCQRL